MTITQERVSKAGKARSARPGRLGSTPQSDGLPRYRSRTVSCPEKVDHTRIAPMLLLNKRAIVFAAINSAKEDAIPDTTRTDDIDLSPLINDPDAAVILMLARGQLNRSFRGRGLIPPDPLCPGDSREIDPRHLDDPAALGIDEAMARFDDCFLTWSRRMPRKTALPVLEILRMTYQRLETAESATQRIAVGTAFSFLLEQLEADESRPESV